jgi:hypothetical protein
VQILYTWRGANTLHLERCKYSTPGEMQILYTRANMHKMLARAIIIIIIAQDAGHGKNAQDASLGKEFRSSRPPLFNVCVSMLWRHSRFE